MLGILDYIKIACGVVGGIILASLANTFIRDPIIRKETRQGYVLEAQKTALEAQLAERDRQFKAGQLVIDAYQVQLKNTRDVEAARAEQSEQEIAAYEKRLADAGAACLLSRDDIEFLRK